MHKLLQDLLHKRKIETVTDLSEAEKVDFDNWDKVLSKKELTMEDVKVFCNLQIESIEGKWKDLNIDNDKKAEFIPYHTVYKALLEAISSPQSAREQVEKTLNNLLQ